MQLCTVTALVLFLQSLVFYFLLLSSLCLSESGFLAFTYLSHNIFLFIYRVLFAPANLLSQCSRLTKNWSPGFTEATVSQYSFNTMGRKTKKTLLRHPIGTTQAKAGREDLDRHRKHEVYMKRELEDPEMSIDRPRSNLQCRWHPCSWIPAFINTNWKQSKYVGEKGLFGIDIKNHPLRWQPCMQWQRQSLFLLSQCFHAMFKLFFFFSQACLASTQQRLIYDQAESDASSS